jgi:uncharacterized protein with HEPN domain
VTRDEVYLRHILEAIIRIERYKSAGREAFFSDSMRQDAIIRQLAVIGEAVKDISDEARSRVPQIPWREIAGMRDLLIHKYHSVDLEQVWEVTQRDLKDLRRAVEQLLAGVP